ncbi:transcriptional regulator with XRE-family HTH domain [Streptococcus gallinaceus]|uniref:helix-turn-helix domain-containing protein n=1 Tax=Streptococcus gallinaceus TaxID=165758 RepID=UPI00209C925B|nr:helix-turn-helix transcriptional regulator [Streptococcus gallinaceus]MCP1638511.1 transcriptional regulator with XRE-family HTH domain [Streptococcus gallinaceus]MCP1769402.1 transcriptional regulator with XRE-family HTH domain [Streptococcus gallinaceus]
MKLGQQIVSYRKSLQLSQEELAEKVYVSRQSISNWENDKTYPDIHSLLLLSQIFQVSLDTLIKGDIEEMKMIINQEERDTFNKDTYVMLILLVLSSISIFPLLYFLDWWGLLIWGVLLVPLFFVTNRIEQFKKKYDLQTYKEIVAVSEGRTLDTIEKREEKAKYPYQKPLIVLIFTLAAMALALCSNLIVLWLIR